MKVILRANVRRRHPKKTNNKCLTLNSLKMPRDKDLELALQLQAQFDQETTSGNHGTVTNSSFGDKSKSGQGQVAAESAFACTADQRGTMSIVDDRWEMLDPSPDMRAMFLEFNDKYFWGRLAGVEVRWSPRMTLCAGLCCYEGHGGLCSIRLSSPLLKLRPRKDLVETLLHEMIHAYLFVTANNKDHDGHGPEFCKHMNRLNKSTGTNISIYHNFHDEVDVYRQHWWRCSGPCQKRPPYYGMVRRAMNRAPSARDPWWAGHKQTCGGSYTKVKEPEGYGVKKGTKRKKDDQESGSGNETKKRVTEENPLFPGKGQSLGGSAAASKLIPKEQNTLDKFLRKTEVSPSSTSSSPSRIKSQDREDQSDSGKENLSKKEKLKALAAIFDSDSSDDEDVVIVKFGKPLEKNTENNRDADNRAGLSQSTQLTKNISNASSSSSSTSGKPTPVSPRLNTKPTSRHKGASTSSSNRDAQNGIKKQDSIIGAFDRMRQKSGDLGTKPGEKPTKSDVSAQSNRQDRSNTSLSRTDVLTCDTEIHGGGGQSTNRHDEAVDMVKCPVCTCRIEKSRINQHLDQCLS